MTIKTKTKERELGKWHDKTRSTEYTVIESTVELTSGKHITPRGDQVALKPVDPIFHTSCGKRLTFDKSSEEEVLFRMDDGTILTPTELG